MKMQPRLLGLLLALSLTPECATPAEALPSICSMNFYHISHGSYVTADQVRVWDTVCHH